MQPQPPNIVGVASLENDESIAVTMFATAPDNSVKKIELSYKPADEGYWAILTNLPDLRPGHPQPITLNRSEIGST